MRWYSNMISKNFEPILPVGSGGVAIYVKNAKCRKCKKCVFFDSDRYRALSKARNEAKQGSRVRDPPRGGHGGSGPPCAKSYIVFHRFSSPSSTFSYDQLSDPNYDAPAATMPSTHPLDVPGPLAMLSRQLL